MRKIFTKQHMIKYIASLAVLCLLRGIMVLIAHMSYFDPMFWLVVVGLIWLEIWIDIKEARKK